MKVAIVGLGYVGKALAEACRSHAVTVYDPALRAGSSSRAEINVCDIAFVCVPTPTTTEGLVDTRIVEGVLSWVSCPLIVIRSTMPVDYAPPLGVCYQPEFISESSFGPWQREEDCLLVVAGGDFAHRVCDFWKPILGPRAQYIATDWRTAAQIKYAVNCHGAVKAAWWREFLGSCDAPDMVRNVVFAIPWIEPYHTLPIGDGVGGKCFPKDLRAWATWAGGPIAKAALEYVSADDTQRIHTLANS